MAFPVPGGPVTRVIGLDLVDFIISFVYLIMVETQNYG